MLQLSHIARKTEQNPIKPRLFHFTLLLCATRVPDGKYCGSPTSAQVAEKTKRNWGRIAMSLKT
jgi:hypothetical protein